MLVITSVWYDIKYDTSISLDYTVVNALKGELIVTVNVKKITTELLLFLLELKKLFIHRKEFTENRKTLEQKFIFQIGTLSYGMNERFSFNNFILFFFSHVTRHQPIA